MMRSKKFFFAGIMGALALSFSACGSDDNNSSVGPEDLSSDSEEFLSCHEKKPTSWIEAGFCLYCFMREVIPMRGAS